MFLMKKYVVSTQLFVEFSRNLRFLFPQPAYNSPSREKRTSIFTGGCRKEVDFVMWDKLALILLIIGGVNWGLVGVFEFDLVAWLFGGAASFISRAIYILVAIAALWCMTFLFRQEALTEPATAKQR